MLPCVSLPQASAVLSSWRYLVLRCSAPHFADAKGHMTATSSVWALVHAALLHLSRFTVSALQVWIPRGAGKIWAGNKQERLWWLSSVMYCTLPRVQYLTPSSPVWWLKNSAKKKGGCELSQATLDKLEEKHIYFLSKNEAMSHNSLKVRYSGKEVTF